MELDFKIPIWTSNGETLIETGTIGYKINFKQGNKWNHFLICVDGLISNRTIHIDHDGQPKKDLILAAISDYKLGKLKNKTNKFITEKGLRVWLNKRYITLFKNHVLGITKETKRDNLKKFDLLIIL